MKYTFLILLPLFAFTCNKPEDDCHRMPLISIPYEVKPQQDTISLGDTVFIDMVFENRFYDEEYDDYFSLIEDGDYDHQMHMIFARIDTNPQLNNTARFEAEVYEGDVYLYKYNQNRGTFDLTPYYDSIKNTYLLNMAVVPPGKGVYKVTTFSYYSRTYDYPTDKPDCYESMDWRYLANSATNDNYYLYKDSPDPAVTRITQRDYKRFGYYAFVVE